MKRYLLGTLALLAGTALALTQGFTPWLTRNVALPAQALLRQASAHVPFAVGEVLCLALLLLGALSLLRAVLRAVKRRSGYPLSRFFCGILCAASALLFSYALLWMPIARTEALPAPAPNGNIASLAQLCERLSRQAQFLYTPAAGDPGTILLDASNALFIETGVRPTIKASRMPKVFRALRLAGICFPWTGEAIVRPDQPAVSLAFVACHEAAHQLGYGQEAQANYIAYRACMQGDAPMQYSATVYALYYALDALKANDSSAYARIITSLSEGVYADYRRVRAFHAPQPGWASDASDAFLRLSGQAGAQSYGQMVDYLLELENLK